MERLFETWVPTATEWTPEERVVAASVYTVLKDMADRAWGVDRPAPVYTNRSVVHLTDDQRWWIAGPLTEVLAPIISSSGNISPEDQAAAYRALTTHANELNVDRIQAWQDAVDSIIETGHHQDITDLSSMLACELPDRVSFLKILYRFACFVSAPYSFYGLEGVDPDTTLADALQALELPTNPRRFREEAIAVISVLRQLMPAINLIRKGPADPRAAVDHYWTHHSFTTDQQQALTESLEWARGIRGAEWSALSKSAIRGLGHHADQPLKVMTTRAGATDHLTLRRSLLCIEFIDSEKRERFIGELVAILEEIQSHAQTQQSHSHEQLPSGPPRFCYVPTPPQNPPSGPRSLTTTRSKL